MRTFKDILTSFEQNDFSAFEQLIRNDREFLAAKRLSMVPRKYQQGHAIQTPPKSFAYKINQAPYFDPRAAGGAPLS